VADTKYEKNGDGPRAEETDLSGAVPKPATAAAASPAAKGVKSLTGTVFEVAKPNPDKGNETNGADASITTSVWTTNERYFLAGDATGAVTCWGAFVPYARLWRSVVPREAKRMVSPVPVAVLVPHSCDVTGVLVVDTHAQLWQLAMASGEPTHLTHLSTDQPVAAAKPNAATAARCAVLVALPNTGATINVLVVVGLTRGHVVGWLVRFTPNEATTGGGSAPPAASTTTAKAPVTAPPVVSVTMLFSKTEVFGVANAAIVSMSTVSATGSTVTSLERRTAKAAAAASDGNATAPPLSVVVGDSDGHVGVIRFRATVAPEEVKATFEPAVTFDTLPLNVTGGLLQLTALPLLQNEGAGADGTDAAMVIVTLDTDGTVALWCLRPGTNSDVRPLAQRRLEATCVTVTQDRRYLLCGAARADDPHSSTGAGGVEAQPRPDVVVLDLDSALMKLPISLSAALPKLVELPTVTSLRLPALLQSSEATDHGGTAAVSHVSQSVNRLVLLCCTVAGDAAMLDFSAFVKPDKMTFHRGSTVAALAIAGNGKFAVSASEDTTLRVWELLSGRPLCVLDGHAGRVWSVAPVKGISAKQAAGGAGAGLMKKGAAGGEAAVNWIVSGADDGTMRLWSLPAGRLVETHVADEHCVWSVASEGGVVASGGAEGAIKLWRLAGAENPQARAASFANHTTAVSTDDGFALPASSSFTRYAGRQAPLLSKAQTTADKKLVLAGKLSGHTGAVVCLHMTMYAFASGETLPLLLSASFDNTVRLWDVLHQATLLVIAGHTDVVWSVTSNAAFHPFCRAAVASGPQDGPGSAASSAVDNVTGAAHPPLIVYTASEDKTIRAWAVDVEAAARKAAGEAAARGAGYGAGAPTPAVAGMETFELRAMLDTADPAACVAMVSPEHVAIGLATGDLLVAELGESVAAAAKPVMGGAKATSDGRLKSSLRLVLESTATHDAGRSLCAIASSKHCLLTGGVDGVVRYHEPWPALRSEAAKSDEDKRRAIAEIRKARLVLLHSVRV
jgi:WD40 repeat protein